MLKENVSERIRQVCGVQSRSMKQIALEEGRPTPPQNLLTHPRSAPLFGPSRSRVEALARFTGHLSPETRTTLEVLPAEGEQGSTAQIRQGRPATRKLHVPPAYDPGRHTPIDGGLPGESLAGCHRQVPFFPAPLCYAHRAFAWTLLSYACVCQQRPDIPRRIGSEQVGTVLRTLPGKPGRRKPPAGSRVCLFSQS